MTLLPLDALSTETSFTHPSCPPVPVHHLCLPLDVLINGCIYLFFKYLDMLRFLFLCAIEYRKSKQIVNTKVRVNPGFQNDEI